MEQGRHDRSYFAQNDSGDVETMQFRRLRDISRSKILAIACEVLRQSWNFLFGGFVPLLVGIIEVFTSQLWCGESNWPNNYIPLPLFGLFSTVSLPAAPARA
jgi:uncharacterized membrane protein YhaH (DUF805 family)